MICVDASLAVKWLFQEEYTDQADALVTLAAEKGDRLVGPPLLPVEITNVVLQRLRKESMSYAHGVQLLQKFETFGVAIVDPAGLAERALALATTYQLRAAYDAYYIAVAAALGCDLWTSDRRLVRAVTPDLSYVKWLGDFGNI